MEPVKSTCALAPQFLLLALAAGALSSCARANDPETHVPATAAAPQVNPRVAVFSEPGFPLYNVPPTLSPKSIAESLSTAGIPADLLDAAALSDPAKLNARIYAVLVMSSGNTYPQTAFANLQAFHRAGGCLVTAGIPFTHPCAHLAAADWIATPGWGDKVHLAAQAHTGREALELSSRPVYWVGVESARMPVKAGDPVTIFAWAQDVSGADKGDDWVFVRFYAKGGHYISQTGAKITAGKAWHATTAAADAPPNAEMLDISPQLRSQGRTIRLDDISLLVGSGPVALRNPGFEEANGAWTDTGHHGEAQLYGPNGIGIGGFAEGTGVPVTPYPTDPLGLKTLDIDWSKGGSPQCLNMASLPAGGTVTPILIQGGKPVAAIIAHGDKAFEGAIDVWTNHPYMGGQDAYVTGQLLERSAIAVLRRKGLINDALQQYAFRVLDTAPKPTASIGITRPAAQAPAPTPAAARP